ncbi:MAG: helix-turn-helix domain-containing protein [Bacteroidia bacterium]
MENRERLISEMNIGDIFNYLSNLERKLKRLERYESFSPSNDLGDYHFASRLLDAFCLVKNLEKDELIQKRRFRILVQPRQIISKLIKDNTYLSFSQVGIILGGQDHANIMHSCKTVDNLCNTNNVYYEEYLNIITEIENLLNIKLKK